jgi:peptidyl-prolyl cis-trans isomerase C
MKVFTFAAIAALTLLAACTPKANQAPGNDAAAKTVATVNGKPLASVQFDFFSQTVAGKPPSELTGEQRSQLLDTLIRAEVVAQQAEKDGLDKQGDAPQSLAMMRLQVLERASMANYLKDRKPTDAELKAEYDSQVAAMPKTQYKARHILVKTREEAEAIIADLKKGAKFEKLAADKSLDNSRTNGGDLGWFGPNNMVKPFVDAVASLKKGETSTPVQTEFGWHVIRLDDMRAITPPTFEAAKEKIEQIVQAKKFKAYEDSLMAAAKVEKTS